MNELNTQNLDRKTVGFGLAAAVAVLFNTLLVMMKESSIGLHDLLVNMSAVGGFKGHHWITHGILVVLVFLLLGFLFSKSTFGEKISANALSITIIIASVVAGFGLVLFFLLTW